MYRCHWFHHPCTLFPAAVGLSTGLHAGGRPADAGPVPRPAAAQGRAGGLHAVLAGAAGAGGAGGPAAAGRWPAAAGCQPSGAGRACLAALGRSAPTDTKPPVQTSCRPAPAHACAPLPPPPPWSRSSGGCSSRRTGTTALPAMRALRGAAATTASPSAPALPTPSASPPWTPSWRRPQTSGAVGAWLGAWLLAARRRKPWAGQCRHCHMSVRPGVHRPLASTCACKRRAWGPRVACRLQASGRLRANRGFASRGPCGEGLHARRA